MRARMDEWTLVLAGQWNNRIFRPEWVVQHLLPGKKIDAEVIVAPGENYFRLIADDLVLLPKLDRLIIGVKHGDDDVLKSAGMLADRIITLLCHTPIQGIGFNIGFEEEEPTPDLVGVFSVSDVGKLSQFGATFTLTEIKRAFQFDDLPNCTVTMKQSFVNGVVRINFNYHHNATSAEMARKYLENEFRFSVFRDKSLELLQSVYNLSTSMEHDNESGVLRSGSIG